jgi:hypothetical protein
MGSSSIVRRCANTRRLANRQTVVSTTGIDNGGVVRRQRIVEYGGFREVSLEIRLAAEGRGNDRATMPEAVRQGGEETFVLQICPHKGAFGQRSTGIRR